MLKTTDVLNIAKKHSIKREVASPNFFEGALLGNGNLGVVSCSRPDGIALYLGHNNVWDIRIDESHKDKVSTFEEVWQKCLASEGDVKKTEWYREFAREMGAPYKKPYPRPYPASALFLFFDRKEYEVLGQELDISNGRLTVTLENLSGEVFFAEIFVSQTSDRVFCKTTDERGEDASIFHRLTLEPHIPDEGLPAYTVLDRGFTQLLPFNDYAGEARAELDRGFKVTFETDGVCEERGLRSPLRDVSLVTVDLREGYYSDVLAAEEPTPTSYDEERERAEEIWRDYWMRSGVSLSDEFLEHVWYVHSYFIRCVLNRDCRCPGLFGNWMYRNIGTAWHGDYHMNYNTQQPFWGLMGANRAELHMPYLRLTEEMLSVSKSWAKNYYKLDGAYFPHSAYPVPMTVMPYPVPSWGWEICETPWTVQSLWWHYTYTKDKALLKDRIYPIIREASIFLAGYMTREGADPKGDGKYHIFPSVVPELYELSEGFDKNCDVAADLTLTKFVFRATLEAIDELGIEAEEAALAAQIRRILAAFPEYPTATSRRGEVFVSVESEDPDRVIYNVPANLMNIFPGEDIDAVSGSERERAIAERSWKYHYNEGGNDLVFYNMIGARLGILDIEKFKRHIRYCMLPNETLADRVTLCGGRYADGKDLDFMSRMGIWIENFSIYAVIDECLLRGHSDVVKLFPNWDLSRDAAFCSMRVKGAFLIDAACGDGAVKGVRVTSEAGGVFRLENPWRAARDQGGRVYTDAEIRIEMSAGETVELSPAE